MRFPRKANILRRQLDITPFAAMFFLLVIFVILASLVYTPGVRVQLPTANDLPGTDKPTVTVAVDASNRLYYENQMVSERDFKIRLAAARAKSDQPLTLVIQADKNVTYDYLLRVTLLARAVGIYDAMLATLPRPGAAAAAGSITP